MIGIMDHEFWLHFLLRINNPVAILRVNDTMLSFSQPIPSIYIPIRVGVLIQFQAKPYPIIQTSRKLQTPNPKPEAIGS